MDVWDEVERLAGRTLATLAQEREFDVIDATATHVLIRPHRTQIDRRIERSVIERAYKKLAANRQITRAEIREEFSEFNPAYVVAILSYLPGVTHTVRPIRLILR